MPADIPQGTDPFDAEIDELKRLLEPAAPVAAQRVGGLVQAFTEPLPETPREFKDIPFAGAGLGTAALLYAVPHAAKNMLMEGINTAGRWVGATQQLPGATATDDLVIPKGGSLEDAQINPQRLEGHDFLAPLGLASMAASPAGKLLAGQLAKLPKDRLVQLQMEVDASPSLRDRIIGKYLEARHPDEAEGLLFPGRDVLSPAKHQNQMDNVGMGRAARLAPQNDPGHQPVHIPDDPAELQKLIRQALKDGENPALDKYFADQAEKDSGPNRVLWETRPQLWRDPLAQQGFVFDDAAIPRLSQHRLDYWQFLARRGDRPMWGTNPRPDGDAVQHFINNHGAGPWEFDDKTGKMLSLSEKRATRGKDHPFEVAREEYLKAQPTTLLADQQRSSLPGAIGNALGRETELQAGAVKRPSLPAAGEAVPFLERARAKVAELQAEGAGKGEVNSVLTHMREQELVRLWREERPSAEIAKELGIEYKTVNSIKQRLADEFELGDGRGRTPRARFWDDKRAVFEEKYKAGVHYKELAKEFNLEPGSVFNTARRFGLPTRAPGNEAELLDQVRSLRSEGMSYKDIANATGVTRNKVAGIIDRLRKNGTVVLSDQERASLPSLLANAAQRPEVDAAGFYSKALEAAKGLKQETGTPEQMLGALRNAGVKDGEIAVTGLDKFLAQDAMLEDGRSAASKPAAVSKNQIISHLQDHRVKVEEKRYGGKISRDDSITRGAALQNKLVALDREIEQLGPLQFLRRRELQAERDGLQAEHNDITASRSRWAEYSLDKGKNPTYRETVVHLPDSTKTLRARAERESDAVHRQLDAMQSRLEDQYVGDQHVNYGKALKQLEATPEWLALKERAKVLDEQRMHGKSESFKQGHFSEPNVLFHARTSLQKDAKGKSVFHIDELQSDWGQKLRDGGVRDEAKIKELEKRIRDLDQQGKLSPRTVRKLNEWGWDAPSVIKASAEEAGRGNPFPHWAEAAHELKAFLGKDDLLNARRLAEAELSTAKASTPGHPLVNTTDQWTTTALRKMLKQAVDEGAEAIAIPAGKTVDGYGMGGKPEGNKAFYEEIVPRNLGKLLAKMDPAIKMERGPLKGHESKEPFSIFYLTPKAKEEINRGQALFGMGGVPAPGQPDDANGGSEVSTDGGAGGMADQQADFEAQLAMLAQMLATEQGGDPAQAQRTVSVPSYTLGGQRMEGKRPLTAREQGMLEQPGQQMMRDAGDVATAGYNALAYPVRRAGQVQDDVTTAADAIRGMPPEAQRNALMEVGSGVGGQLADAAVSSAMPYGLGKVAQLALSTPVRAGIAAAAGGLLAASTDTGEGQTGQTKQSPEQTEAIKREQMALKKSGDYIGPIDGQDGPLTTGARAKKMERDTTERKDKIRQLELEVSKGASETQTELAKQQIKALQNAEAEALRMEAARIKGNAMLSKAEEDLPWYRRVLREYGPAIGYGLGAAGGVGTKYLTNRAYNAASAAKTVRANALLGEGDDIPGRVGKVNQFWSEGQRGAKPEIPFVSTPGSRPPFQANALAPQSGELYQTGAFAEPGADAGRLLAAAGGTGLSYAKLQDAQGELEAAQQAALKAPDSEVALRRLQTAKDMVAIFRTGLNASIAAGTTYAGTIATMPRKPGRPDVNAAEAERYRLDAYLNTQAKRQQGKTTPPATGLQGTPSQGATPTGYSSNMAEPAAAATATRMSVPRERSAQTTVPPENLPEGYSFNRGAGRPYDESTGRFVAEGSLPKKKGGVQTDDLRPLKYNGKKNPLEPDDY